MTEKLCTTCNQTKPLSQFTTATTSKNFRSRGATLKGKCKRCDAAYAKEWRTKNPNYRGSGKMSRYPKEDTLLVSAIGSRLTDAKTRAKKYRGETVTVTKDYLYRLFKQQQGMCALSGVSLSLQKKTSTTLSLDKIDSAKGYDEGNVQWLAWAVNRAKGDLNTPVFMDMCKKITERCNDYPSREYSQVAGSAQPLEKG